MLVLEPRATAARTRFARGPTSPSKRSVSVARRSARDRYASAGELADNRRTGSPGKTWMGTDLAGPSALDPPRAGAGLRLGGLGLIAAPTQFNYHNTERPDLVVHSAGDGDVGTLGRRLGRLSNAPASRVQDRDGALRSGRPPTSPLSRSCSSSSMRSRARCSSATPAIAALRPSGQPGWSGSPRSSPRSATCSLFLDHQRQPSWAASRAQYLKYLHGGPSPSPGSSSLARSSEWAQPLLRTAALDLTDWQRTAPPQPR